MKKQKNKVSELPHENSHLVNSDTHRGTLDMSGIFKEIKQTWDWREKQKIEK